MFHNNSLSIPLNLLHYIDCKWSCPQKSTFVCGSDNVTHENECKMNKLACETRTAIIAVHEGKCSLT